MKLTPVAYAADEKVRVIVGGVWPTYPEIDGRDVVIVIGTATALIVTFDVTDVRPADAAVTANVVVDAVVFPVSRPADVNVNPDGTFAELNVIVAVEGNTLADNWFELATFEYTLNDDELKRMTGV